MRNMNKEQRKEVEVLVHKIMRSAVSSDYARYILEHENEETENTFMDDVIDDVMCSSAWDDEGYYNDDDIRLAIGRVLIDRLGIDY